MRRLDSLLRHSPDLQALVQEAGRLEALQQLWSGTVPAELRACSRAAGVRHRRITVFADNGAVAARLRLLAPGLLKTLQNKGLEVTAIRVEVQVKSRPSAPRAAQRRLGHQAADSLLALAERLPDSPLRSALTRLARHG